MTTAYEAAKQLMLMREDELEDVLDELAINWPTTYAFIINMAKRNAEWHIDGEWNYDKPTDSTS